jgi:hypothetical protein
MGGLSIWHLILLALIVLVFIYPIGKILSRAGWSPWLSLLWLVPVLNIAMLWAFALGEWPALDEARDLSRRSPFS